MNIVCTEARTFVGKMGMLQLVEDRFETLS